MFVPWHVLCPPHPDAVRKPWERSNSAEKSSLVSRSEDSLRNQRIEDTSTKIRVVLICLVYFRVRPIGSTSEADTEFDRMKQVGVKSVCVACSKVNI